jgi:hypothetical protein
VIRQVARISQVIAIVFRSVLFRPQTGFRVEPWPVYDLAHYADGFLKLAAREWTALIGYRILGRTRTLFPGPAN